MPIEVIETLDDPRLEPYRNLKATNLTRWSNRFVAEGMLVVRRLLASDFEVVSILASRRNEHDVVPLATNERAVYLLEHGLAEQLVGYTFHTGVLACGLRKPSPTIESVVGNGSDSRLLAVCPNVNDPENIGAVIRLCAGFGLAGVILGTGCADPFSRRVLRVSMGTAFFVPIIQSNDVEHDLVRLRQEFGFELCAAVLDPQAEPLETAAASNRMALMFGNEKHGLERTWIELCGRKLTIPMAAGADSLNVAVAAGIFFYHFSRLAFHAAREKRAGSILDVSNMTRDQATGDWRQPPPPPPDRPINGQ
jgi:tRNA G18 (ribose-2'-O)-methylase SpoU